MESLTSIGKIFNFNNNQNLGRKFYCDKLKKMYFYEFIKNFIKFKY